MKRFVTRCAVFGAGLIWSSFALAAQPKLTPPATPNASSSDRGTMAAYFEDAQKKPEPPADEKAAAPAAEEKYSESCGCASEPACGCEQSCSAEPSCGAESSCGSECGCGDACSTPAYCFCEKWGTLCCVDSQFPCCKPGDPWKLQNSLCPCSKGDVTYGGWLSMGYYTDNDPFSARPNDLTSFWDNPNDLNFDQEWFYVEKLAKGECGNWAIGYRADLVYGVDAQKTQAFGNPGALANPQGYDAEWDNGKYGWALPQAYVQLNNGDWDVKVGHFFTPLGYEVIPKTGNFFYSHALTMFNAEPFTHTGALASYKASDKVTYYMGWTLGWDTGFDQFGHGSNFIGGATLQLADSVKYTYLCTAGDLGWRGDGYSHSNVIDFSLSSKWEYIFQSDYLDTTTTTAANEGLAYGINQYLFYTINDCWKWGTRCEWFKTNQFGPTTSFYETATGLNYKASANLIVRPEVKWNWGNEAAFEAVNGANTFNNTLFGVDAIYTF
jgi:hypothetical protein